MISTTGNQQNRPSLKIPDVDCDNSVEGLDNTPTAIRGGTALPNLLGEYDCGDEPEEQDDSLKGASSDQESGESENDIVNDDIDSPAID